MEKQGPSLLLERLPAPGAGRRLLRNPVEAVFTLFLGEESLLLLLPFLHFVVVIFPVVAGQSEGPFLIRVGQPPAGQEDLDLVALRDTDGDLLAGLLFPSRMVHIDDLLNDVPSHVRPPHQVECSIGYCGADSAGGIPGGKPYQDTQTGRRNQPFRRGGSWIFSGAMPWMDEGPYGKIPKPSGNLPTMSTNRYCGIVG